VVQIETSRGFEIACADGDRDAPTAVSLFVQPTAGPQRPLLATPARPAPSARRTTSIDVAWPDLEVGHVEVVVRGQDLRTSVDSEVMVADRLDVTIVAELASGRIVQVDGGPASLPDQLLGASVRKGLSRHLASVDPDGATSRTLAFSALDDLPGAFLVSGYSMLRAGLLEGDPELAKKRAAKQGDICIGWATGGPVHVALAEQGRTAVPFGPEAPAIEDGEAMGWHPLAPMPRGAVRRRRQLDVWPSGDDGGLEVQSHFRDSYAGDEPEMVMHEYVVEATLDADRQVTSVQVDPRVLPWESCPGATASANVVVGAELAELEALARTQTSGPSGCTHLTSTLRGLADVQSLAARL
jgi:hypothetical protein